MWGGHCEYIYTDRRYGNGGATAALFRLFGQNITYNNTIDFNAYINAIEHFDPNLLTDVHRWIPQGIPYDLFVNRNDAIQFPGILDHVSGYTYQQSFAALQSDVRSVEAFKTRLLLQNSNNQQTEINELFAQYGY